MAKTNFKQLAGVENIELSPDGSIIIKLNQAPTTSKAEKPKELEFEKNRISQTDAAALFDVSVQTIINWSNKGIINRYKLGNRVFYLKSELLESASKNNTRK